MMREIICRASTGAKRIFARGEFCSVLADGAMIQLILRVLRWCSVAMCSRDIGRNLLVCVVEAGCGVGGRRRRLNRVPQENGGSRRTRRACRGRDEWNIATRLRRLYADAGRRLSNDIIEPANEETLACSARVSEKTNGIQRSHEENTD